MRHLFLLCLLLMYAGHSARAQPSGPVPAVPMHGGVYSRQDSVTGVPRAELRFFSWTDSAGACRATTGPAGQYRLALPGGRTYRVDVFRGGHRLARQDVRVPVADSTWASFYVDYPVEPGIQEPPPAAFFGVRQVALRPWDREKFAHLSRLVRNHPQVRVRLEGHADAREAPTHHPDPVGYLRRLGAQRAQALDAWLRAQGVPASQLVVVSYGAGRPASSSNAAEDRQLNRRVDLISDPTKP
ncbi:OmpA family protein [Hymenobacter sp. M29]|uniref:OmpA family protein n=1 Tax=Hymenobacter mellowenesis TaxID=3063995 RepID=A0ABT9ABB0_9BACT|nr:OmpA family protein [Hymenobacter sp. M29]MDO7846828.1 OmpA family protein [Hymenobacter sp. M29]